MKKEKSCGAVIYCTRDNSIYYLLSKMGLGHISLSKGHVEENETEVDTAKREIFEETSLKLAIDTGFRKVITYCPFLGILKDVVFFVAKCNEDSIPIDKHDKEVTGFLWLKKEDAIFKLTYESDKEVLREASQYIERKEYGKF